MYRKIAANILLLTALCSMSSPEPQVPGWIQWNHGPRSEPRQWTHSHNNYSAPAPNPDFLNPVDTPSNGGDIHKTKVPRQSGLYGLPNPSPFGFGARDQFSSQQPPFQPSGYPQGIPQGFSQGSSPGYPQIYKVDNLIIIANPVQQQTCKTPLDPSTFPGTDSNLDTRFGENEPSKCTWAIVACCAPGSPTVRYNCFELLGCSGMFLDIQTPCSPTIVDAATRAALAFYRNSNNGTATGTDNNNL